MADATYALKQFGVDAAMLYIGTTAVGPSIGGYTHDPGVQWRTVEADGFTTEQAGMSRIIGWDTHLRGQIKELTAAQILRLNLGFESDGSASNNAMIDQVGARAFFAEDDFIRDVRLIYRKHDPVGAAGSFGAIIYPVMRVVSAPQSGEDNNEQIRDVDLKAILAVSQSANDCPFFEVDDYDHTTFSLANYVTLDS